MNTWEELVEAYMSRFFPPALTAERRGEIIVFKQGEEESLYNAWERFKRLLKRCPMHGIDLPTQMDIFFHAMNYRQVIEDLAKCNYKAPSEASGSSSRLKGNGIIGLDKLIAIEAKLDVVMNELGNNERRIHTAHEVGAVDERIRRSAEELVREEPYQVKETKYMNEQRSYHFKPNPNLPTHYTPALRNHESFSYGGGVQQGSRPGQNYQQAYAQPRFQEQQQQRDNRGDYQGHKITQSFEDQMLHFMSENKMILNFHEKKFSDLENFKANTTVFQIDTNASLKNLKIHIKQLAQAM